MGTQQILLIVLSVIIVGVAIVVGIGMFNRQAYNSNKTAIASDAQQYASEVVQHYKTPVSQGGAMGTSGTLEDSMTEDAVAAKIGIGAALESAVANENGRYYVSDADTTEVEITGIGKAVRGGKSPKIVTTITFPNGDITAAATDEE